jgi:hypothetical protein
LAEQLTEMGQTAGQIANYRTTVNFDYWRSRCEAERTENAIQAREIIYKGNAAFEETALEEARDYYEDGMARWRVLIDANPLLADDPITSDDLIKVIQRYKTILKQLDEPMPEDFVLQEYWDEHKPDDAED